MREVTMIAGADSEDAQPIEHEADGNGLPGDAGPDRCRAGEMHQHEGYRGWINDIAVGVARFLVGRGDLRHGRVAIIERHEYGLQPSGRNATGPGLCSRAPRVPSVSRP